MATHTSAACAAVTLEQFQASGAGNTALPVKSNIGRCNAYPMLRPSYCQAYGLLTMLRTYVACAGVTPEEFQASGAADQALQVISNISGVPPANISVTYTAEPPATPAGSAGGGGRKLLQQQVRHHNLSVG